MMNNAVGDMNNNPLLDTRAYEVDFMSEKPKF